MTIKKRVYLDHAATTPLDHRVNGAMLPFYGDQFGNPSALYKDGRMAKEALKKSREKIANVLGCSPDEIIFTGSGTESDALAILGIIRKTKGHLITTNIEHHAVLNNVLRLAKEGFSVTFVPCDRDGLIKPDDIRSQINDDTTLISVMYANNEIGTIQPIDEIGRLVKEIRKSRLSSGNKQPLWFHTDACQASGYLDLNVERLGVDLMTINGSKIYGPKGTGLLFMRRGIRLEALYEGGGQENKLRSGTENVAGIVGLAEALTLVQETKETENARLSELRDYFIRVIFEKVPKVVLNGHPRRRLANNINVSILDIEGEAMLLYLDEYGIEASTGSACDSATLDPSHVILALGRPYEFAHASIRFTLGKSTSKEDVDYVLEVLPVVTAILRKISPINLELDATEMSRASAFAGEGLPHWERKRGTKLKVPAGEISRKSV